MIWDSQARISASRIFLESRTLVLELRTLRLGRCASLLISFGGFGDGGACIEACMGPIKAEDRSLCRSGDLEPV